MYRVRVVGVVGTKVVVTFIFLTRAATNKYEQSTELVQIVSHIDMIASKN